MSDAIDPVERLAAAIEHTAWMQAATQAAGLGWVPRGCSREDFAVARAELRAAIQGLLERPVTLTAESVEKIAAQIGQRLAKETNDE